jgi:hypothetical protein
MIVYTELVKSKNRYVCLDPQVNKNGFMMGGANGQNSCR